MSFNVYELAGAVKTAIITLYPAVMVGVVEFEGDVVTPAVLIAPIGTYEHGGSMDEDDMATCRLQISNIASTVQQAAAMQMAVYRLLMGHTAGGYTAPLSAAGQTPLWRSCDGQGPIIPGDQIYRSDDTYCFKEMIL